MCVFKKAFTLAEVLITLLIIGIIASITIPGLIADTQDQQYKVAWKKVYSDMDQATKRIMIDNGGTIAGLCDWGENNCLRNLYLSYLNYVKSCDNGQEYGNCWVNGGGVFLDGTSMDYFGNNAGLVLSNGASIDFYNDSKDCSFPIGSVLKCARIRVDVNGLKGPNKVSKDIFEILLQKNGIIPAGTQGDGQEPSVTCINGGNGIGCSAQYLYQ
jgi:prepilin-type N-terminal cleavage/methylation domain-containing protein